MTGGRAMEGTESEEVSSRLSAMQSNHDVDAIKQNRGQLSFRSRKMLNLFHKSGGAGQAEKKIAAPVSGRDVKLEIISSPPELAVEAPKEEPKKKVSESKKTVRTIVTRHSSSLYHSHLKDRENTKPTKATSGSQQQVVVDEASHTPPKKKQLLPARLKLLETFYEWLEAAISLLAIRRQMCTFKSVCKTVEQMSKRRFLRSHLAQLKSLFPEVIEIDYVRVPDQDSRRDVWDLRISLKHYPALPGGSPMKGPASPSRDKNAQTLRRKKEFHSRLLKFAGSHNEDADVPQHSLPQRPLGGQSLSSPNVSVGSPSIEFVSRISPREVKQGLELKSEAASCVIEDHDHYPEIADAPEANFSPADGSEEVYEFSIVKPGSVTIPDIELNSHFPASFMPHFHERGRELNVRGNTDSAESFDMGLTSHFSPSFKPRFQERQRELSSFQSGSSSGTVPSEVHLQSSAIASRSITRFPTSFERRFLEAGEEGILEVQSQPSPAAKDHVSVQSWATLSAQSSPKSISADLNREPPAHGVERTVVHAGDSSAAGEEGDERVQEASKMFLVARSSIRNTLGDEIPATTPALTPAEATSSLSPAIMSPVSTRAPEMLQEHLLSPQSVRCLTPAPSTNGAAGSVPNTPYAGGMSSYYSPSAAHTPASLSPSRHNQCAQDSSISNLLKSPEGLVNDAVPGKSQGTMRALKFGSPIRPPRPPQRQAGVLAPDTPQINAPVVSTPTGESKQTLFQSSTHTPQATTPETSIGQSFYSPARPPRSRALRFSTPEKVRDNEASVAELGYSPSSSEQLFKSPHSTVRAMKPPRFMSPPKSQVLSAPATPVPSTPVRSILYSPPKRTKFNRGFLFSDDEQEEKVGQVPHTLSPDGKKAETRLNVACGTPDLLQGSDTRTLEDSFTTPVKDSPSKTRKALSYVSEADLTIIDSLPTELVHSVREKERKIKDESTKELILEKRRQQMMAGVPKMFNQLRLIFQSLKRSVLPRNELIKNVLSTNADITDRGEVEERLKLLIELAPDWITQQLSANGNYIYRINKSANVTRIQKKILEAC